MPFVVLVFPFGSPAVPARAVGISQVVLLPLSVTLWPDPGQLLSSTFFKDAEKLELQNELQLPGVLVV